MRIAFDIDGVIVNIDLPLLRILDNSNFRNKGSVLEYYYSSRRIQLNPLDFVGPDDELYFITSRRKEYKDLTVRWKEHYFPRAKLILLDIVEPGRNTIIQEWEEKVARVKSEALNKYRIDVYFEDNPRIVKILRRICPSCRIILYGNRLEWNEKD